MKNIIAGIVMSLAIMTTVTYYIPSKTKVPIIRNGVTTWVTQYINASYGTSDKSPQYKVTYYNGQKVLTKCN